MRILQKLPEWQVQAEQFFKRLLQRVFPGMSDTALRWCWMIFYGLAGMCALGATLGVLLMIGAATAGFYFGIQDDYFPRVDTAELSSPARVGERVSFVATELSTDERLPLPSGRTIPAIKLGGKTASLIYAGNIRLDIKAPHVLWMTVWEGEQEEALRQEKWTEAELDFLNEHYFIPARIKGDFLVEGQLKAPNEVRVKVVDDRSEDNRVLHQSLLFCGLFVAGSLCVYVGTWGVWWSMRSLLRHLKRGNYRPGIGLCLSALLHGSSLIILVYALGLVGYELFLAQHSSDFAPLHLLTELQLSLCAAAILLLQVTWFRLRTR